MKIEQLLSDHKSRVAMLEADITRLQGIVNTLNDRNSSALTSHASEIASIDNRSNERVRQLQAAHKDILDARDVTHQEAIESLKRLHREELETWRRR